MFSKSPVTDPQSVCNWPLFEASHSRSSWNVIARGQPLVDPQAPRLQLALAVTAPKACWISIVTCVVET